MIDQVGLVAIEGFVDESDAVFASCFTGDFEGFGEPLESLPTGDVAAPFSLHRSEDGRATELAAEVDHLENEIEGFFADGGIGIGERKAVLHHAGSGSDGGDAEVVFGGESVYFIDRDEVGSGEKEFDRVVAVLCCGGKAFGERLVENEGPGGGLGDLGKSDCGFHRCVNLK